MKILKHGILIVFFCSFYSASKSQNLKVGDKLPDSFWQQEHLIYQSGVYKKQNLSSYQSSLIILDYWATWCSSCIIKFPELEELQLKYPDKLKILLVNPASYKDKSEEIDALFNAKRPPFKNYTLPSIVSDTTLIKIFTPVQLPQNIWIIGGYVRAITSAEFVTETNIQDAIKQREKIVKRIDERKK